MDHLSLRKKFQPQRVKVLFVGESAPSGGRFFYCGDSNLYFCMLAAFARVYGPGKCESRGFLDYFKRLGCYLDDLCPEPVNKLPDDKRLACREEGVEPLAARIREMQPQGIVIVMKDKAFRKSVERAIAEGGLSQMDVHTTTFPAGSNRNRCACIDDVEKVLLALLKAGVIEAPAGLT